MVQKSPSNKEKVLVVDDEASIRRILDTRLVYDRICRYNSKSDGEEALISFWTGKS